MTRMRTDETPTTAPSVPKDELGERVAHWLGERQRALGISQKELEAGTGYTQQQISQAIGTRPRRQHYGLSMLDALARQMGTTLVAILQGEQSPLRLDDDVLRVALRLQRMPAAERQHLLRVFQVLAAGVDAQGAPPAPRRRPRRG